MTRTVLYPDIPLYPVEQSLGVCQWLHTLTERELEHWPRRNVWTTPVVYPGIPCPGGPTACSGVPGHAPDALCEGVYISIVCLN